MTDESARIHIAASNPAFPAKREAAVQMICAAITEIATSVGYTRSGTNWARNTDAGRSVINLQRSRFGWNCQINLRFLTPDGGLPANSVWTQHDDIRLDHFFLPNEGTGSEKGTLTYLDIHDDPASLALPMQILRDCALPWLDAHHNGAPDITRFLPQPGLGPMV